MNCLRQTEAASVSFSGFRLVSRMAFLEGTEMEEKTLVRKACRTCGFWKEMSDYHKDKSTDDGFRHTCKVCAIKTANKSWENRFVKSDGLLGVIHSMKLRCYNKNHVSYHRYGGRGITICDEWLHDHEKFFEWANENGYKKSLQLDRVDNDLGYSPDNCRFVTCAENSRNNKFCKLKKEYIRCIRELYRSGSKTQGEIAEFFGVSSGTICSVCADRSWKEDSL